MHFDDKVSADLVRQTIHPATRRAVEEHLADGCEECSKALSQWQMLASAATKERAYAPPQDVVRMVKQEFTIQRPKSEEETTLIASLVFDSFAQPAAAGVRSAASASRQLLYTAKEITIDLRFEFQPLQSKAVVVGQVLDKNDPCSLPIPLLLFNENGAAVLEMQTSEYGEFQFEFNTKERLRLSFELAAGRRVQVPLADVQA